MTKLAHFWDSQCEIPNLATYFPMGILKRNRPSSSYLLEDGWLWNIDGLVEGWLRDGLSSDEWGLWNVDGLDQWSLWDGLSSDKGSLWDVVGLKSRIDKN